MAPRATGRTPWDSSWPPSARIPGHGIVARSRRGAFATTWWGRRFVDAMEAAAGEGRLSRGRAYARAGQVLDLVVSPGSVSASVQGSRLSPYRVELGFDTWDERSRADLARAVAHSPAMLAAVLGGAMPEGFEALCEQAGLSLFPASLADARFDCTCPDLGDPCKHAAAVVYLLAEWLDDEPFGVLTLRGARREELLAQAGALAGERAGSAGGQLPGDGDVDDAGGAAFYRRTRPLPPLSLPPLPLTQHPPAPPLPGTAGRTVLDDLDASVLGAGGEAVADRLRAVYAALAARGEAAPERP